MQKGKLRNVKEGKTWTVKEGKARNSEKKIIVEFEGRKSEKCGGRKVVECKEM